MSNTAHGDASVVIDIGTGFCKCGFTTEQAPRTIIPSVVGRRKPNVEVIVGENDKKSYVGYEAQQKRHHLILRNPIEKGEVVNWDDMEDLFSYVFDEELSVEMSKHSLMLTEPPLNPLPTREKMTQILFEKFKLKSLYMAIQSVLALFASAKTIGITLDSGEGLSYGVPVCKQ